MLVFSCKDKDDDATSNLPTPAIEYFPLTVGSYWVYDWYSIDALGNEEPYPLYHDSIYISGDTVIGGLTYSIMEGTHFNSDFRSFYRDSSGFLVNGEGGVPLFTTTSEQVQLGLDTIFIDSEPFAIVDTKMQPTATSITVPAGTFADCLTATTFVTSFDPNYPHGVREQPYYYAKGVGRILHRIAFYSTPGYFESKLAKYHIE